MHNLYEQHSREEEQEEESEGEEGGGSRRKVLNKMKIRGQSVVNTFSKPSPREKSPLPMRNKRVKELMALPAPEARRYYTSVESLIKEIDQKNPKYAGVAGGGQEEERVGRAGAKSPVSIHSLKMVPKPPKTKTSNYR